MIHPKTILDAHGLQPSKGLGQNFLFDQNILSRIVEAAEIDEQELVLEIGPGLGHLTDLLARRARQVIAVEVDSRLIPLLEQQLREHDNIRLLHADILDGSWARLVDGRAYKVVGNVPYYITGAILRHFLERDLPPKCLVLTVQKEVADRLTAQPGDLSLLSVSVQFFGSVKVVDVIKAGSFWPRPEVDSAIIRIDLKPAGRWEVSPQRFFQIARTGFSHKRKQLQKNLRQLGLPRQQINGAFERAGIKNTVRAQSLTLEQWVALARALFPSVEEE